MAKQPFVDGNILSAAQVNALQANDYNQTVSAKTASYVLVAADVGTRITMNSASATTITVNTALFSAGDTLEILNIGAGVCTVTAGTATVSTVSSLALSQYDGGVLYFTSAGVSVFTKWAGAAATSGGMTLLSTTAIAAAASVTISSINQTYKDLIVVIDGAYENSGASQLLQLNADASALYSYVSTNSGAANTVTVAVAATSIPLGVSLRFPAGAGSGGATIRISNYTSTTTQKIVDSILAGGTGVYSVAAAYAAIAAISSIKITWGGTPTAQGNILIYGVK